MWNRGLTRGLSGEGLEDRANRWEAEGRGKR